MAFLIDKQTLSDLQIFGSGQEKTVYGLFNRTHTRGGAQVLKEHFSYPLSDPDRINLRRDTIRYFLQENLRFPFKSAWFDAIEHYLENQDTRTQLSISESGVLDKLKRYAVSDADDKRIRSGILACISLLQATEDFVEELRKRKAPVYTGELSQIQGILDQLAVSAMAKDRGKSRLTEEQNVYYDRLFRFKHIESVFRLLALIYELDVWITAGQVALTNGFSFARALEPNRNTLDIQDMFHPAINGAVSNTVHMDASRHILFLTGANMAGKSTFMKTLGVVVFLAHIGFPVPAARMDFSVLDGLFTTINLADNVQLGYSHFYGEVRRIKTIARHVGSRKRLLVIVDELFRGTNVKDAYDATLLVTEAFASQPYCFFVVSTHIIEAGSILRERCPPILFRYLPTKLNDGVPHYTYQLKEGISADRHGMMIVENQGIISILESGKYKE